MNKPLRAFGELLTLDIHEVDVIATDEYLLAGIFNYGRGLFQRGPIKGAETSYKKLHRLHASQLVVSRLKAFEGAVTIVPDEFDGWFLSPEFPTFRCIENVLDSDYMLCICRWPEFWAMLEQASKGIEARRERVHAKALLRLALAVPPFHEQRQVARKLDRIWMHTTDVARLSDRATNAIVALNTSMAAKPDLSDAAKVELGWRETSCAVLCSW